MKILKFFQGGGEPLPDTVFFLDSIGFNDTLSVGKTHSYSFEDGIGFLSETGNVVDLEFEDEISFDDYFGIELFVSFEDGVGFISDWYMKDWLDMEDGISFDDIFSTQALATINFEDSVGFDESSSNIYNNNQGYLITWKTRTRKSLLGYGGAIYGDVTSYGDGSADDLKEFILDAGYINDSGTFVTFLANKKVITIVDPTNPDANAHCLYAPPDTFNFRTYKNLTIKIWQKDTNGVISPVRQIKILPITMG